MAISSYLNWQDRGMLVNACAKTGFFNSDSVRPEAEETLTCASRDLGIVVPPNSTLILYIPEKMSHIRCIVNFGTLILKSLKSKRVTVLLCDHYIFNDQPLTCHGNCSFTPKKTHELSLDLFRDVIAEFSVEIEESFYKDMCTLVKDAAKYRAELELKRESVVVLKAEYRLLLGLSHLPHADCLESLKGASKEEKILEALLKEKRALFLERDEFLKIFIEYRLNSGEIDQARKDCFSDKLAELVF